MILFPIELPTNYKSTQNAVALRTWCLHERICEEEVSAKVFRIANVVGGEGGARSYHLRSSRREDSPAEYGIVVVQQMQL